LYDRRTLVVDVGTLPTSTDACDAVVTLDAPMRIIAATDGSCLGNPGPGGWAWVIEGGGVGSGGADATTNSRMELQAVLELLKVIDSAHDVLIQCDSRYVIGIFTEWLATWKAKGKVARQKNADLIGAIDDLLEGRKVEWRWVRGHVGHPLNELADRLAQAEATNAGERSPTSRWTPLRLAAARKKLT
jgi:ribonuclease HI